MLAKSKEHLREADESWFAHFCAALSISSSLLIAGAACAIHALIPGLCTRTASRRIADVQANLEKRRSKTRS